MTAAHDTISKGKDPMQALKLVAVDLDGPLLVDTFGPILHKTCEYYGWDYSRDFERNTLSRPRHQATQFIKAMFGDAAPDDVRGKSDQEMAEAYFRFRAEFLKENPLTVQPGADGFLRRLAARPGLTLVCYGGLDEDYMRRELGPLAEVFDRYVCTNDFRPGVREIVEDIYGIDPRAALFIDDVNYVGEAVRDLGAAFIGVPSAAPWSWQRHDMEANAMPVIVPDLASIDDALLDRVDALAAAGGFWEAAAAGRFWETAAVTGDA